MFCIPWSLPGFNAALALDLTVKQVIGTTIILETDYPTAARLAPVAGARGQALIVITGFEPAPAPRPTRRIPTDDPDRRFSVRYDYS